MIADIVVGIAIFAIGFWAGKTYQTKEALIEAVKSKINKL